MTASRQTDSTRPCPRAALNRPTATPRWHHTRKPRWTQGSQPGATPTPRRTPSAAKGDDGLMNHTDRQTFPLSSIHPGWTGERILAIEHPLRRGLVRLSDQLGGADAAIIVVLTEFDYDGMLETIEAIEPIHVGTDSVARTHSMLEEYRRAINARYPALTPDSESVYPLNVMPATRAVVPGTFPRQV